MYPKTSQQFDESKWKAQAKARSGASIGGLVQKLGSDGQNLVARLFQVRIRCLLIVHGANVMDSISLFS